MKDVIGQVITLGILDEQRQHDPTWECLLAHLRICFILNHVPYTDELLDEMVVVYYTARSLKV